jgi:hypothetical protein
MISGKASWCGAAHVLQQACGVLLNSLHCLHGTSTAQQHIPSNVNPFAACRMRFMTDFIVMPAWPLPLPLLLLLLLLLLLWKSNVPEPSPLAMMTGCTVGVTFGSHKQEPSVHVKSSCELTCEISSY